MTKNGTETDMDCGGSCAPVRRCALNSMCKVDDDCQSGACVGSLCSDGWKVQYQYYSAGVGWSGQSFQIVSLGGKSIPLSSMKIHYWFTADGQTLVSPPACFTFSGGCANVMLKFVAVSPPLSEADTYLEVSFTTSNTLAAGASSGMVTTGFHGSSFTAFTFTNDYSANAATTTWKDAPLVTLYDENGNLIWGTEPHACAADAACP